MTTRLKRVLYESIMKNVSIEVKRALNEEYDNPLNEGFKDWAKKMGVKAMIIGTLLGGSNTLCHAATSPSDLLPNQNNIENVCKLKADILLGAENLDYDDAGDIYVLTELVNGEVLQAKGQYFRLADGSHIIYRM